MKRVTVEIDQLSISGLQIGDRAAFAKALREGLQEGLSDPATLQSLLAGGGPSARLHLDGGRLTAPADAGSAALGRSAAEAIVREVKR